MENVVLAVTNRRIRLSPKEKLHALETYHLARMSETRVIEDPSSEDVSVKTVIAPGNPGPSEVDDNVFRAAYSNVHGRLLKATAHKSGVTLTRKVWTYEGCVMSMDLRHSIPSKTDCRSLKKLGGVSVGLSGPKDVAILREKRDVALCRDNFYIFMWVYFSLHKDDIAWELERLLAYMVSDW